MRSILNSFSFSQLPAQLSQLPLNTLKTIIGSKRPLSLSYFLSSGPQTMADDLSHQRDHPLFSKSLLDKIKNLKKISEPRSLQMGNVVYNNYGTPEQNATILFDYTLKHETDLPGVYNLITEAITIGKIKDLSCVFQSDAMNEILDNKDQYQTVQEVFDEFERRQDELISCLSPWQKLKYGPRIKRSFNSFKAKMPFIEGLSELYGKLRNVKTGVGAVDLLSYFFRKDKLDQQAIQTFDIYLQKLKVHLETTNEQPSRKRRRWFWFK